MNIDNITNIFFREAIAYIDTGNITSLEQLLKQHPELVSERANIPEDGYFAHPCLLWFVADNPIRHKKLPGNIAAITRLLLQYISEHAREHFHQQVNYALGLVVTGHTPRNCGVQIALMDVLIDAGAAVGNGHAALANHNMAAAFHLLQRGGGLTLATVVCLDKQSDIDKLIRSATSEDLAIALVAASFYGKPAMVRLLVDAGANPNAWLHASSGFHSHAAALHQAVYSGSLECVQFLVESGADPAAKDRIYDGTPLGWALNMFSEETDGDRKKSYAAIATYLGSEEH